MARLNSLKPGSAWTWRVVLALGASLAGAPPAFASCAAPSPDPQCRADFDQFSAIAWTGGQFVAAGHLKSGPPSLWTLAFVNSDGKIASRRDLAFKSPADMSDDIAAIEIKKVLALPKGVLALVGTLRLAHSSWISTFAAVVGLDGQIKWFRPQIDASANLMFQSAAYDPVLNRVIAVGRRTSGGDDGSCTNWSQSYTQGFDVANGDLVAPQAVQGTAAKGLNNRQGIYDIAPIDNGRQFAIVGFSTVPNGDSGRCKDEILVGVLSPPAGAAAAKATWNAIMSPPFVDDGQSEEDGFAIAPLGMSEAIITGQKTARGVDHALAHAVRVRWSPFAVEGVLSAPDAGDSSRFRFIVPMRDPGRFLLGGSISQGPQKLPHASMTQVVSNNLRQNEELSVSNGAADIFAAATSSQGRSMVAGYGIDEKGGHVGWLDVLGAAASAVPEAPAPRAAIDRSAIDLDTIQPVDDAIPLKLTGQTAHYLKRRVPDFSQLDIALTVTTPQVVRILAVVGKGEVDMELADIAGHLLDFSNYRGAAPQLLVAKLASGTYKLSLFTQKDVRDIQIELGVSDEISVAALLKLMSTLGEQKSREQLATQLTNSGFSNPPEPSIALGGETALSVLAAQAGTNGNFGPNRVGVVLTKMVESR
jgi:hypothetical protein